VSKDKIHIDKLFQNLKDHQPEVSASDWNAVNNKLHDSAWKEKFANYEPKVDENDLPFVPHPVSDKKPGQRKSLLTGLLLLLLLLLFVSIILSIPFLKKEKPLSNNPTIKVNQKSEKEAVQQSSAIPLLEEETVFEDETNFSSMGTSIDSDFESNEVLIAGISSVVNSGFKVRDNKLEENNLKYNDNHSGSVDSDPVSEFPNKENEQLINDHNTQENIESVGNKTTTEVTEIEKPVEQIETEAEETNQTIVFADTTEEETQSTTLEDSSKYEQKKKMKLFANFGLGLFTSTTDLGNLQGNSAARYFAHFNIEFGKAGVIAGLQHQSFAFRTEQMRVRIYDSFPHLNMQGDTIGWFQRNHRDTSKQVNLDSRIDVISIPVGFQLRLLEYKKSSLYISGLGTFNMLRNRGIYGLDENNYTKEYTPDEDIIQKNSLGYSIELKYGYAIRPRWMLTLNCAYFNTQNISKSTSFELQPMGYSLNFGLNYQLR
jgi:hypothetical protein